MALYSITWTSLALSSSLLSSLRPDQSDSSSSSSLSSCSSSASSIRCFLGSSGRGLNCASNARRKMAWRSFASVSSDSEEGVGDREGCSNSARDTRFLFPSVSAILCTVLCVMWSRSSATTKKLLNHPNSLAPQKFPRSLEPPSCHPADLLPHTSQNTAKT